MLFISHDLAVVRKMADRTGVLFAERWWKLAAPKRYSNRPSIPTPKSFCWRFPRSAGANEAR